MKLQLKLNIGIYLLHNASIILLKKLYDIGNGKLLVKAERNNLLLPLYIYGIVPSIYNAENSQKLEKLPLVTPRCSFNG